MSLQRYLSSDYIAAVNRLSGQKAAQRVVAYVESYDDVWFWRSVLDEFETPQRKFEIMLPSQNSLARGKKIALSHNLGPNMIACVDADYDWVLQGATEHSKMMNSPYVIHTFVYAIENLLCYAPALHDVCTAATLNDRIVCDFEGLLRDYSKTIWPLFVWNVLAYKYNRFKKFSLSDFAEIVEYDDFLQKRVNQAVSRLQHRFPEGRETYKPLMNQLLELGLTPETTYLYMRGHDLYNSVVLPVMEQVCDKLRREREREIQRLACHRQQQFNELASYRHAVSPVSEILRKHNNYKNAPQYQWIVDRCKEIFES